MHLRPVTLSAEISNVVMNNDLTATGHFVSLSTYNALVLSTCTFDYGGIVLTTATPGALGSVEVTAITRPHPAGSLTYFNIAAGGMYIVCVIIIYSWRYRQSS